MMILGAVDFLQAFLLTLLPPLSMQHPANQTEKSNEHKIQHGSILLFIQAALQASLQTILKHLHYTRNGEKIKRFLQEKVQKF